MELEQLRAIDKTRIRLYVGRVSRDDLRKMDAIIEFSLGMHVEEDVPTP